MSVANMLPTMHDKDLASLQANATRLTKSGATPGQRQAATDLLPLIKAELKVRGAAKPLKAAARTARKPRVKKADAEATAAPA
ncbi:MAG: hypothetical protein ACXW3D_05580 [Caulobacteraceae bacterium]